MNEELHDHDRGLAFDLSTSIARRRLFTLFAGAGLAAVIAGCSSDSKSPATSSTASPSATSPSAATVSATATNDVVVATSPAATTAAAASSSALQAIPEETAGPYPGDGSNGLDVLKESGIVRSDIRASF
ncbi:MAG: 3,4-dioxygenase subunit beta, partial [Ilumatobacteraceae bacterium]